jgi:hypothetical protein
MTARQSPLKVVILRSNSKPLEGLQGFGCMTERPSPLNLVILRSCFIPLEGLSGAWLYDSASVTAKSRHFNEFEPAGRTANCKFTEGRIGPRQQMQMCKNKSCLYGPFAVELADWTNVWR